MESKYESMSRCNRRLNETQSEGVKKLVLKKFFIEMKSDTYFRKNPRKQRSLNDLYRGRFIKTSNIINDNLKS